jgi:hypothetical protein
MWIFLFCLNLATSYRRLNQVFARFLRLFSSYVCQQNIIVRCRFFLKGCRAKHQARSSLKMKTHAPIHPYLFEFCTATMVQDVVTLGPIDGQHFLP